MKTQSDLPAAAKNTEASDNSRIGGRRRGMQSFINTKFTPAQAFTFVTDVEQKQSPTMTAAQKRAQERRVSIDDDNSTIHPGELLKMLTGIDEPTDKATEGDNEEEEEDWEIPDDVVLPKEKLNKYFGKGARTKFFEQMSVLQQQKNISATSVEEPLSPNLITTLRKFEKERLKEIEEEKREQHLREKAIMCDTKIVIRTQTLNPSELYDQMRIVQKPAHLTSITLGTETSDKSDGEDGEDGDVEEEARRHKLPSKGATSHTLKPQGRQNSLVSPQKNLNPIKEPAKTIPAKRGKEGNGGKKGTNLKASNSSSFSSHPDDGHEMREDTLRKSSSTLSTTSGLDTAVSREESKLEFVCVDYRDGFNKKIDDRLKKDNSLFQYVESKQLNRDFYDDYTGDKYDALFEEEFNLLKTHSLTSSPSPSPSPFRSPQRQLPPLPSNRNKQPTSGGKKTAARNRTPSKESNSQQLVSRVNHGKRTNNDSDGEPLSPRSRYIDNCIRQRLNPKACLILRKRFTRELNLKHLGMGDKMAALLAEAIINVPFIRSLNVRDNNLEDDGLAAIVNSIQNMTELVELDMSFNMIGPKAANSLAGYLSKPNCPLKRLVLQKADVDDDECRDFVSALTSNRCLEEIDLSENLVGSSENLNTVMPDITTGGEALADLLKSESCPLKTLKLGWNLIRLDGAVTLCESLGLNKSLTQLELSYNSLSSSGGIALGDALQDNKVLKTLYISNNNLDSVACLTICSGIFQNECLEVVSFNENPIGEQGAKVLMLLPTIIGSRVRVSARNCNLQIKDPKNWFDSSMLIRNYHLHLDNPFDRAVAIILTYLVPAHQTYVIVNSEYFDPESKKWIDVQLKEAVDAEYYKKRQLSMEQMKVIEGLQKIQSATADIGKAIELFKEADEDGSGELDEEEFAKLIEELGMDPSRSSEIMAEYDVDGGGVIEIQEFLLFLKTQRKESAKRLKELTEYPIVYSALEFGENNPKRVRYLPPKRGQLKIAIIDGFTQKETYRVISPEDRTNILKVAEESGDLLTMTSFGVKNYKIRLYEALSLANTLLKDSEKVAVLASVLPQMAQSQEARLLVSKIVDNNITDLIRLKRTIGQFYRVIMGTPDGYYCLDLSNEMDRCCVNRLLEISMTTQHFRSQKRSALGYGRLGDTSQHGNFSCFRNEMLNRRPVVVTVDFASPLPRTGKLEFDFVSQKRYSSDNFILSDVRFTNLLMKTFQLHKQDRAKVLRLLQHMRKACNRTVHGNAKRIYEIPKERALEIGLMVEEFYARLPERNELIEKTKAKEGVKAIWEFDPNKVKLRMNNFHKVFNVPSFSSEKYDLIMHRSNHRPEKRKKSEPSEHLPAPSADRGGAGGEGAEEAEQQWSEESEDSGEEGEGGEAEEQEDTPGEEEGGGEDEESVVPEGEINAESELDRLFKGEIPALKRGSIEQAVLTIAVAGKQQKDEVDQILFSSQAPSLVPPPSQLVKGPSTRSLTKNGRKSKKSAFLPEILNRYVCLMASRNVPPPTKAIKTLELLIDTFESVSIYMRHLEMLVVLFEDLGSQRTSEYFGTYRVELIVALFSNLVDVYNIEILYRHLSNFEIACLLCRIGFLNLFNPMKPEGGISVDISRHEERAVVKMLAHLAVVEPGDNLPFVQFRWERGMDCMPGYELTELWMTEAGMPKKGIWECSYYAGDGKEAKGCKPHIKCRKGLCQLVFVDEEEMMTEEEREQEKKITPVGPQYVLANEGTFIGYLAYNEEAFKEYQEKHPPKNPKDKDKKSKKK